MIRLQVWIAVVLVTTVAVGQDSATEKNALDVIEGSRGGRHWVDQKTAPPKSPQQALDQITIEPGYQIALFASEPLVRDPVAICFDANGRLYAAEYGDYPIGPADGGEPLSKIVMLEDSDGDSVADVRHVYADQLDFAHSMMAYKDGLLVGAKDRVLFLRDDDGDHVADVREVLFDGFTPAHPQMQIGNPRWGIDNWVYMNYGPGKVASTARPKERLTLPRKDFRFDHRTMRFEADSGMGQFGNTVDRWGNRFYCTNRNPIMTTFLTPGTLARNPYHIVSKSHYDVAPAGGDSVVFPLVEMKSNYLSHAGTHTSACGTTAYIGDLGDESFRDSVFVCEPIGHLVTRTVVMTDKLRFSSRRAQADRDFVASTDTWFRPSSLATGPDGALYLADMYRLWVEHPKFLPPEIAEKLDWRAGEDRGRIYRIVPEQSGNSPSEPRSFAPPVEMDDAVELLAESNGWRQFLGQRLLVERQAVEQEDRVRDCLDHPNATTRLHGLWTLDGLGVLNPGDVLKGCGDANESCRIAAVTLARQFLDQEDVLFAVQRLANDSSQRVRFEVALTLSASNSVQATKTLAGLALRDGNDPAFIDGLLTSLRDRSGVVLGSLVSDSAFRTEGGIHGIDLVKRLASIAGARGDVDELKQMMELLGRSNDDVEGWWKSAAIAGLGNGLTRYRGDLGRLSLSRLINNPPAELADSVANLNRVFERNQAVATDGKSSLPNRVAAVELLAYQSFDESSDVLGKLLSSEQPVQIQTACLDALQKNGSVGAAQIVLDRWSEIGPSLRGTAVALLMRRSDSSKLALEAMVSGRMNRSALSIDQRVRLLKHSDEKLRGLATELFGGAVSSDRQHVAKKYSSALELVADANRGKKVFTRVCAGCHRIAGQGHQAGPDLTDVRNRSKPALLYDILDPNSKVEPRFTAYSVLTDDGAVFTGLIESETSEAIVLKMAEGKSRTIGRAEIDQLKASDVSLMPEGIEKDVTPQQMADLLAYLKGR